MGASEVTALISIIHGNVGLFAGLALTLCGLYQLLVARNSSLGIIMIAVGLCLPFVVNIMSGIESGFCKTVQTLGGTCAKWNNH